MTNDEKKLVLAVFDGLTKIPDKQLNTVFGTQTIIAIHNLRDKLYYADYCEAHGIKYEDMTEDDFIEAYESMHQE